MGWSVTRKITVDLPETNTSFIDSLKEKGIEIPQDVRISQSKKSLIFNIVELLEKHDRLGMYDINGASATQDWFGFEDDMKSFSKYFPTVLFKVYCESSEGGCEFWVEYYKNGEYYQENATVTYPDFDETKLEQ